MELEIISIKDLYSKNRKQLTLPHRADFYHVIWIEKGNPTHLVDFNPVKISRNSILFINKARVHLFDSSEKYDGKLILFTDRFFCKNSDDVDFLNSTILFNDLLETTPLKLDGVRHNLYQLLELMEGELLNSVEQFKETSCKTICIIFCFCAKRKNVNKVSKKFRRVQIVIMRYCLHHW
jgi:AraC family transcriptional regulator, transcriptional activator of pobA